MRSRRSLTSSVLILLAAFALTASACTVHLITDYDPYLDSHAADLGTSVDAFISKMESAAGKPEGAYAANMSFYNDTRSTLNTLKLRAAASAKSDLIVAIIDQLTTNITNLESLHKSGGDGGLKKELAEPAQAALDIQFAALYKLESALKRNQ